MSRRTSRVLSDCRLSALSSTPGTTTRALTAPSKGIQMVVRFSALTPRDRRRVVDTTKQRTACSEFLGLIQPAWLRTFSRIEQRLRAAASSMVCQRDRRELLAWSEPKEG